MPSFSERLQAAEMMDDFAIDDERLTTALDNLRAVNRFLGGYTATMAILAPQVQGQVPGRPFRVLDLATGAADFPAYFVRWAARHRYRVEVVGVDANPTTVSYAGQALDRALPPPLREQVHVMVGDALALSYADKAFDVCVASLFMHHLQQAEAVTLLREMNRVARRGLIVNDLHRHPLAYHSIRALAALLPVSPMFRHDGPISVLRAFTRGELHALADAAQLTHPAVRWHWAFRWTLSTFES